jgi:MtaA/CmuA family methyltransferase
VDFQCPGDNLEQIPEEVVRETGATFPGAHTDQASMSALARALRKHRKDTLARVPFCLTVEAEALGAHIKLGNALAGPRVDHYAFSSIEEMSDLQDLDITGGRIGTVLNAVSALAEAGEQVALSVEGPFTIISSLIDPLIFYRDLRKDPSRIRAILAVLEQGIVRYCLEGVQRGAAIISYADPVGSMDILGPKVYQDFSGPSSRLIVKRIQAEAAPVLIHLCGKTSTGLEKTGLARSYPIPTEDALTYGQAMNELIGQLTAPVVIGHQCIKWSSRIMDRPVLWEIELS